MELEGKVALVTVGLVITTPMTDAMPDEAKEKALAEVALGHAGTTEDVAWAVSFLASERARFITGEVIKVDGGQYI
jgi:3-oxoacyl-[acyl-carrier protein] reductase